MSCTSCGCTPCTCPATVINNPQIIGGVFDGPTINGATINGGTTNQQNINGAQIDCSTQGCTQPAGICNDTLATTAFTCTAIENAISSSNAAFCEAVGECVAANPELLCPAVASCINSIPGIINTTNAFGFNSRATTTAYGVTRFATGLEFAAGECLVAIDPCTLAAALASPQIGTQFWTSFVTAVQAALGTTLCDAVDACGFARLLSPAFTGVPTAPTAAPGTNTTQIATTAFVQQALNLSISSANAAFCAAVTACVGGGGGGGSDPSAPGNFASFTVGYTVANGCVNASRFFAFSQANYGCSVSSNPSEASGFATVVTFNVAQPNVRWTVNATWRFTGTGCGGGAFNAEVPYYPHYVTGIPSVNGYSSFLPIGGSSIEFGGGDNGSVEITFVFSR